MLNLFLTQNYFLHLQKWNRYYALGAKAVTAVLLFFTVLFSGTTSAQLVKPSLLNCSSPDRCTSKDLEVVGIAIDAPLCTTCTPGTTVTYPLKMTIHNGTGSVRTSFSLYGTLSSGATINGVSGNIFICVGAITVTKGDQTFLNVGTVTYKCGDVLTLTNNYLAWTDASGTTADRCNTYSNATTCADIAPKCGTAESITIQGPLTATATPTAVKCKGGTTGSINLTPSGGTAPYTFLWSNGATTEDISGLTAGTYSVTVTDAHKCTFNTSATVTEPATALMLTATPTQPKCYGQTGSVSLSSTGGTPPYTYDAGNPATSGLAGGTYTYKVTDANGCVAQASATISAAPSQLVLTATATQPKCYGETGSVSLSTTGGTAPYTYDPANPATSSLAAGTYTYKVTDANGCTAQASVTINAAPSQLVLTATPTQPKCYGETGSVSLSTTGGTAPYTYDPANPATSGLAAGTYTYKVTDANGCTAQASVTISAAPSQLVLTATPIQSKCSGDAGSVTLSTTGGTPPYTYDPANPATSGLVSGTYTYKVTDANGCKAQASVTITVAPSALVLTATPTQPKCYGETGSVSLSTTGGTAPYTYDPANPATSSLAAGTYTYKVTDANGCTAQASVTINAAPSQLVLTATPTQPKCYGETGSVSLSTTGGTAPYTYDPANPATSGLAAGTYTYKVTDANGCTAQASVTISAAPSQLVLTATPIQSKCSGDAGSVTLSTTGGTAPYTYDPANPATSGLVSGTYTYKVTDANGCKAQASVTITVAPSALVLTATPTQPKCYAETGSVSLSTTGGTAPYTYDPANPATSSLAAGTYTYKVTDANGCTAQASVTINAAPSQLVLTATPTQPKCYGETGSVSLSTTGGTAPYTYDPANPATSGLAAGTYTYKVIDANGCTAQASVTISAAPSQLVLTATPIQSKCSGDAGSVTLSTTGGTPPYTYDPANPATSGLVSGTYTYKVTDANGCTAQASVTITVAPSALVLTATPTQPKCYGETGSVSLSTTGGTAPYTYDPANPATSSLAAGTYTYKVTDANGCTAQASVTISAAPSQLVLTATVTQPTCTAKGSVVLSATGGTGAYTFGGDATSNLDPGTYNYTVTDANGCKATASATLVAPNCAITYCTYTQGFWGNKNGLKLLNGLIGSGITIGTGPNSITIPSGSGSTLNSMMPGGSTPSVLPSGNCDITKSCISNYLTKQGRFDNVLLSQTITLALNIRLNNSLGSLAIQSGCITTSDGGFRSLPSSVVNYLTQTGAATVQGLLNLANAVLGGSLTAGVNGVPSLSDINDAVTAINEAFDGCKTFTGYKTCSASMASTTVAEVGNATAPSKLSVSAYPNPYQDKVKFIITSPVSGQGSLDVYNLLGQKVKTVFSGSVQAGLSKTVEYAVPNANRTPLMYIFRVGDHKVTGKLLH